MVRHVSDGGGHPVALNPVGALDDMPFDELLAMLLRQFKRLLAARGIDLSDSELKALANAVAASTPSPHAQSVRAALADIIAESENVLKHWNLTFAESLATGMDAIPGWETTAEFLEIANEKSNAELRISAGAALAVALGDLRYARYLLDVTGHDAGAWDVDAVIARRVLLFASGVAGGADGWLAQVNAWLKAQGVA